MLQTYLDLAQKTDFYPELKTWFETKKFKDADVAFLAALKTPSQQDLALQLMKTLMDLRASFSECSKLLETGTELILMDPSEDLFENKHDLNLWSDHLRLLRYPSTISRDKDLKSKLETLPWPKGSKIKFERRGDRAGVELKLFISSQADLTKMISALERVKDGLNS